MKKNRFEIAEKVGSYIRKMEAYKAHTGISPKLRIAEVCDDLSIFDWWNEQLSISQLKQMKKFLETACKLGFNGYVCFKVGAKGCANGMWAYTEGSEDGHSPNKGRCLYHSFVSGRNDWDYRDESGVWAHEKHDGKSDFTLKEVESMM